LYAAPYFITISKSWRVRWLGHVANRGDMSNPSKVLVGKPEEKGPLGRSRQEMEELYCNGS
jgi:hypothetical protein